MHVLYVPEFPIERLEPQAWVSKNTFVPLLKTDEQASRRDTFHKALREDIAAHGVKNPVCIWDHGQRYWLRYGQSRITALKALGRTHVPAIISGPTEVPREDFGGQPIDTSSSFETVWTLFRDPPHYWHALSEGYLDFLWCTGPFEAKVGKHEAPEPDLDFSQRWAI